MPAAAQAPSVPVTTKVPHRKAPHLPRRRAGHKHEEDDAETVATDESYTDDSGMSEEEGFSDDESEEEYEDASDGEGRREVEEKQPQTVSNGDGKRRTDTDVMKNGIDVRGKEDETIDYEDMGNETTTNGKAMNVEVRDKQPVEAVQEQSEPEVQVKDGKMMETPYERKRREHDEYRKRRAEDPSFVPNRGRFFMHDHRYDGTGSNGFRPFGRGRGRFGDFQAHQQPPPPELAGEWPHDMHEQMETKNQTHQHRHVAAPTQSQNQPSQQNQGYITNSSFIAGRQRAPDQPRSFGRTLHKGTVQIQVNLPGMNTPIVFSEVPCKIYTRLPFHRPPLRRDKPVRIALPDAPVRYIYPNVQRSFIFIPRAMRPGGSGYIRGTGGRGRGGYPTGGRNFYGGGSTAYSPSVGMSRRSSLVYDTHHHTPTQVIHPPAPSQPPVMSFVKERQTRTVANGEDDPGRPVVRLPSVTPSVTNASASGQYQQSSQAPTPRATSQQPPPSYTPSINPIPYREARATPKIPMYQPRPQKAVNVAEIDSPAVMHFPHNYNGGVYTENIPTGAPGMVPNSYAQHTRHPSYPSQTSGTPLSQIPETAHARSFQPNPYPHQPYFQPYPPPHGHSIAPPQHPMAHAPLQPHHGVFHPPPPPYVAGPSPMSNGAPNHYPLSQPIQPHQPMPHQPPPLHPQASGPASGPSGPTTFAQESNGMVYYSTWDPNAAYYQYPPGPPGPLYSDAPGIPITPAPDGQGQNVGGTMYYYPPQLTGPGYYSAQ